MAMQDSDNLIVGRGNASYKISYEDFVDGLPTPVPPTPPLQVGKGVITPDTGVKEGDDLTGSATVINGENPIVIHCWEQDGVETVGTNHYTAQVGTIRYRQKVTDDNNVDPVVGEWSDPVVAEEIPPEPNEPNADMHGLRFDSARQTHLLQSTPAYSVSTLSMWVKTTSDKARQIILGGNNTNRFEIKDGKFAVDGLLFSGNANINQWTHVVLQSDSPDHRLFINGVDNGTVSKDSSTWINNYIGTNSGLNSSVAYDGYLSDVYFVDGKIAPPTTFGKYFPGDKWGPLDNSVVQVKPRQPATC